MVTAIRIGSVGRTVAQPVVTLAAIAAAATDPKPRLRYTAVPAGGRVSPLCRVAPPGPRQSALRTQPAATDPLVRQTDRGLEAQQGKPDMTTGVPDLVLGVAPASSGRPDEQHPPGEPPGSPLGAER